MRALIIGLMTLRALIVAFLALRAVAAPLAPPAGTWQSTENYAGPLRANWLYQPATRTFQASWQNGTRALLCLDEFDERHVVISRYDTSGPTAGLRVRYEGLRTASGYSGQVTWLWLDQARRGTWSVTLPPQ